MNDKIHQITIGRALGWLSLATIFTAAVPFAIIVFGYPGSIEQVMQWFMQSIFPLASIVGGAWLAFQTETPSGIGRFARLTRKGLPVVLAVGIVIYGILLTSALAGDIKLQKPVHPSSISQEPSVNQLLRANYYLAPIQAALIVGLTALVGRSREDD